MKKPCTTSTHSLPVATVATSWSCEYNESTQRDKRPVTGKAAMGTKRAEGKQKAVGTARLHREAEPFGSRSSMPLKIIFDASIWIAVKKKNNQ